MNTDRHMLGTQPPRLTIAALTASAFLADQP